MKSFNPIASVTLRGKLAMLNILVVGALLWLSGQAWHTSSVLEHGQDEQLALSEALHESKQADMMHDAIRSHVMASLLVGQVPGLNLDTVQEQAASDVFALGHALGNVGKQGLPAAFAEPLTHARLRADAYGRSALALIKSAAEQRSAAAAALPAFEEQFQGLLTALDEQSTHLSAELKAARERAAGEAAAARRTLLWTCVATVLLASLTVLLITQAVRARLRALGAVAQAIADGDLARRVGGSSRDELGDLGRAVDQMASGLSQMIDTMRGEATRAGFGTRLAEALDMADREQQVAAVTALAMADISTQHPMELLVSDSSQAQMERAAEHPSQGAPGCGVGSPYDCVAVRRGNVVSFGHSEALNACNHLRGRPCGPVSAVCVPVTFMGRAIGVLHTTGPVDVPMGTEQTQHLGTLGTQIGMRIGTVRAFETTQIQASTDSLTGLPNRRMLEQSLRSASAAGETFSVVMCDLDRFKMLNDTHGHAAGDNALRTFADVLRQSLRDSDVVGRWGGEEFAFVLKNAHAQAAQDLVDRLRKKLVTALQMGKGPAFTASFGIADSTMAQRPEQLIQMADVALYQAKASGRDRACIADPTLGPDDAPTVRHAELSDRGMDIGAKLAETA
jgi:diguanylate cyclase (GGDEF)-like protein